MFQLILKAYQEVAVNVRFGSNADMCSALVDVRFTPESGHVRCKSKCPLCADFVAEVC